MKPLAITRSSPSNIDRSIYEITWTWVLINLVLTCIFILANQSVPFLFFTTGEKQVKDSSKDVDPGGNIEHDLPSFPRWLQIGKH